MGRPRSLQTAGLLACFLQMVGGMPLGAQGSGVIIGIVGDTAGRPLPETEVVALHAKRLVRTDSHGIFVISLPPGEETFIVRRIGFLPQTFDAILTARDSTRVGVNLASAPSRATVLPDLTVEAEGIRYSGKMTGFGERMLNSGVPRHNFLTRKDIEESGLTLVVDVVTRAGLKVRDDQRPDRRMRSNRSILICPRGAASIRNIPKTGFLVDGTRMNDDFDIDSIDLSQVEAIEVYRSASQIPSQYNMTGYDCAVFLWLRGGN